MTNEELDRWLAEKVMGWTAEHSCWRDADGVFRESVRSPDLASYELGCNHCDWWHPTTNAEQAIDAAEKARADGRITDWMLRHDVATVDALKPATHVGGILLPYLSKIGRGKPAESLSRALYAALSEAA